MDDNSIILFGHTKDNKNRKNIKMTTFYINNLILTT